MANEAYKKRMRTAIETKKNQLHIFIEDDVNKKIFNETYFTKKSLKNFTKIRYEDLVDVIFQVQGNNIKKIRYKKTTAIKNHILDKIKEYIFNTLIMENCIPTNTKDGARYSCLSAEGPEKVEWFNETDFANKLTNQLLEQSVKEILYSSDIKVIDAKVQKMTRFLTGQLGTNGAGYKELKSRVQNWPQLPQNCNNNQVWPGPMKNTPLVYTSGHNGGITKIYKDVYHNLHPKTWPTSANDMFEEYKCPVLKDLRDRNKKAMYNKIICILNGGPNCLEGAGSQGRTSKGRGRTSQGRTSKGYHQYVAVEF